ncbi:MAG: hypothetical protein GEV04_18120 [Actinophytocola sp.]|nr:hypothetical protein [Actinophytocola sp.]
MHAFVHALNTKEAFARCLDLPHGSGNGIGAWRLRLNEDDQKLRAVAGSSQDTATFDLAELIADV